MAVLMVWFSYYCPSSLSSSCSAGVLVTQGEYGAVKALFGSAEKLLESNGTSYKVSFHFLLALSVWEKVVATTI